MSLGQLIVWVVIGALAGSLASWTVKGKRDGFSIANALLGMIGAVIGGFVFDVLDITIGETLEITLGDVIAAFVGSLILLIVLRMASKR